jgi:hypothetical protein
VAESLPRKYKALSANSSPTKKANKPKTCVFKFRNLKSVKILF